jgi:hypothetical protein
MIAKAGVKRGLVLFEDLINAQLLDQGDLLFDPAIWAAAWVPPSVNGVNLAFARWFDT